MTTKEIKEYLGQIKKIDTLMRNKRIELKQAASLGVEFKPIENSIKQLQSDRQVIISNIQELAEAEYDVLHKVYVQGKTLYEVASDRDISYSMATTIHGRALQNLAQIIKKQ